MIIEIKQREMEQGVKDEFDRVVKSSKENVECEDA